MPHGGEKHQEMEKLSEDLIAYAGTLPWVTGGPNTLRDSFPPIELIP